MHVVSALLPPDLASEAHGVEPQRFSSLVRCLRHAWETQRKPVTTTEWTSPIHSFLSSRTELKVEDVSAVATLGLDILSFCHEDLIAQAKWSHLLERILRKYRRVLDVTIEWRPLYDLLLTYLQPRGHVVGVILASPALSSLVRLIERSRRYFKAGAAHDIWEAVRHKLGDLSGNDALEAIGFLSLFMPTGPRQSSGDVPWGLWLEEWMDLWGAVPNCSYWDQCFSTLLARCAKHLPPQAVAWEGHVARLATHYLHSFAIPVGSMQGSPLERTVTYHLTRVFAARRQSMPRQGAKTLMYLLGRGALPCLQQLTEMLEQYYHPSNTGSWSGGLEVFLRHSTSYFLKRLAAPPPAVEIGREEREGVVLCVLRLVERSSFSKYKKMPDTSAKAASDLSYVAPSLVLPGVIARFRQALETDTATHQLEVGLFGMALCVRPLVLAGQRRDMVEVGLEVEGVVAECLEATLAGLDANDPQKTLSTLQLYLSLLSSVAVGVEMADWVAAFLDALFSLLRALEPPSDGAEPSFLMESNGASCYVPLLDLLFSRLPPPLFLMALAKVGGVVGGSPLRGAGAELGALCSACLYAAPQAAVKHLLEPQIATLTDLLKDCPSTGFAALTEECLQHPPPKDLTSAMEHALVYHCTLISSLLWQGGSAWLHLASPLTTMLHSLFNVNSHKVQDAAASLLAVLLPTLLSAYPTDQYSRSSSGAGGQVEEWVGLRGESPSGRWHVPSREEKAVAEALVALHLEGGVRDLALLVHRACSNKEAWRTVLTRMSACLRGVRSNLPLLSSVPPEREGECLEVVGGTGCTVASVVLREQVGAGLHSACDFLLTHCGTDTANLALLAEVIDLTVNASNSQYTHWTQAALRHRAALYPLLTDPGGGHNKLAKRRPRWVQLERAYLAVLWRAAQAGYRQPMEGRAVAEPHTIVLVCKGDLLRLGLHPYRAVRDMARPALQALQVRFPLLVEATFPLLLSSLQEGGEGEEVAQAVCSFLATRSLMRFVTRSGPALEALMKALMASSHHESPPAQTSIANTVLNIALRFSTPPAGWRPSPALLNQLKTEGAERHWKYALMGDAFLLLLARREAQFVDHFCGQLDSTLPPLRNLAVVALNHLIPEGGEAAVGAGAVQLVTSTTFATRLLSHLAVDQSKGKGGLQKGDLVSLLNLPVALAVALQRPPWPRTKEWSSMGEGTLFSPTNAALIQKLVTAMPALLPHLEKPVRDAVGGEKASNITAAEVLGGLLACQGGVGGWVEEATVHGLVSSPVETVPEWAQALRFALTFSVNLRRILDLLLPPLPAACGSGLLTRRYMYCSAALGALLGEVGLEAAHFQSQLLTELEATLAHPARQVREQVGLLLSMLTAKNADSQSPLYARCHQLLDTLCSRAHSCALEIQAQAAGEEGLREWMETVLYWVMGLLKSGDARSLEGNLVRCLSSILALQEMGQGDQDLALLAKQTLAYTKYHHFSVPHIPPALGALTEGSRAANWHTRAASLSFLQAFVYRHALLLQGAQWRVVEETVFALLIDKQLEVRELASLTLCGLLRVHPHPQPLHLRCSAAATALTGPKQRNKPVVAGSVGEEVRHGAVLGVAASIRSVPYDVPHWLPPLLMLLAHFVGEPPPMGSSVAMTFAEFRRTHADTWTQQRTLFTSDQLEVLSDLTLPPSYFV